MDRSTRSWRVLGALAVLACLPLAAGQGSPLYLIAGEASPEELQAAIDAGADVHQSDASFNTPLHLAARSNPDPAAVETLLAAGAELESRGQNGFTPLMLAAGYNANPDVVRALLAAGAELETRGVEAITAIMLAIAFNREPQVVQVLLDAGADIRAHDGFGFGVLDIAEFNDALTGTEALANLEAAVRRPVHPDARGDEPLEVESASYFRTRQDIGVGIDVVALAAGDFDGDGHADLVVAGFGSAVLRLLPGIGDGSFAAPKDHPLDVNPVGLAVADYDGDGILDIAVLAARDFSEHVAIVLLGAGDGTFREASRAVIANRFLLSSVVASDLEGRGRLDLVIPDTDNNAVVVLRNEGGGAFGAGASVRTGTQPFAVAAGDVDGDGIVDLAVLNIYGKGSVSILIGNGDGSFEPREEFEIGPFELAYPGLIELVDLRGDGTLDLVVSFMHTATTTVFDGHGDGTFTRGRSYVTGSGPQASLLVDIDGDGILDHVIANARADSVTVLFGDGHGGFGRVARLETGRLVASLAAADFDGDGHPDLAAANMDAMTVSLYLARPRIAAAEPAAR